MTVTILHGDCIRLLASYPDESVDCILTDPPYGETELEWDVWPIGWPAAARRVLKKSGSMWVFGSQRMFFDHYSEFQGWKLAQDIVWEKQNGTGFLKDRFRRVHECALHFYRDDAPWAGVFKCPQFTSDARMRVVRKTNRPSHWTKATGPTVYVAEDGGPRLMRSVIFAKNSHGKSDHPTQKPLAVVEPLLTYSCPPGGLVLDCFAGSGTTGIAAKRHGIHALLMEASAKFVAVAERRLENDAPLFAEAAE